MARAELRDDLAEQHRTRMSAHGFRVVKRLCWALFVSVCVFHLWLHARSMTHVEKDQRGQSHIVGTASTDSLCAPLNVAAVSLLVVIGGLSILGREPKHA